MNYAFLFNVFIRVALLVLLIFVGIILVYCISKTDRLRAQGRHYRVIAEASQYIIMHLKLIPKLKIIYLSPKIQDITGYMPSAFIKNPELIFSIIHPDERISFRKACGCPHMMNNPELLRFIHRDGRVVWIEFYSSTELDKKGYVKELYAIGRDITQSRLMENIKKRHEKFYTVLNSINEAIVRVKDINRLCNEVCRILVKEGLFRLAWIGLVNAECKLIEPVASYGFDNGYLDGMRITLDNDNPEGGGPGGQAARLGGYCICNNIESDPIMQPWREAALKRGYRSTAAFPLKVKNRVVGIIWVYAAEFDFFDKKETQLLESLAANLSIALDAMEREKQRRQVEEALMKSEERYRRLIDIFPDAIIIHRENRILFANNAAFKLVGAKNRDDIIGKRLDEFLTNIKNGSMSKKGEDEDEMVNTDIQQENRLARVDGKVVDVEIKGMVFEDAEMWGMLVIIRDISRHKRIEELKQKLTANNKLLEKTLEYDKLKIEFFSNISHELRTPINVILGAIQLMELYGESIPAKGRDLFYDNKYIRIMKQNCYRLLRMVNNLIDITKIDAGYFDIQFHNHDIVGIIEDITLSVVDYVENKGISLIFDTDVEEKIIACDPDKIERIILNLLSNAAKFTPQGGKIKVSIQDKADHILVCVEDTGVGIPTDKLDIIFNRFRQIDKYFTRNQEGSGIGLSIVKSLVEKHGGTIWVESDYGKGSKFFIRLPARLSGRDEKKPHNKMTAFQKNHVEKIAVEFADIYTHDLMP